MTRSIRVPTLAVAAALVLVLVAGALVLGATVFSRVGPGDANGYGPAMMGGYGNGYGSGNGYGPGMMGGYGNGYGNGSAAQPGNQGFVPGTATSPRVVEIVAGPGYTFSPSSIAVQRGETVTFVVTAVGPYTHEFMVGPAADVAADVDGTPEVADIGMMQSKSLTYTFDGSGPFAYACHAPGHYEAGMKGTIAVVG
jgi:plastocyanin